MTSQGERHEKQSAASGSTGIAINIAQGATGSYVLASTPTPFSVDTSSTITNNGALSLSGNGTGVANRGAMLIGVNNGNTITNASTGVITTTGAYNTLVNNGTIQTTGTASSSGNVDAVVSNTVGSSFTATITNLAGGQIISDNGIGVRSTNGNTTITNAGLIQGGGGTAIQNGNDMLILQCGLVLRDTRVQGLGNDVRSNQGLRFAAKAANADAHRFSPWLLPVALP
ncbi:hypothetical protein [Paraburkholderia ferrariae]|uniref:hypothetical protein n=1 Tax=Paraburkholderia ferrariae TaxID=386056 RepID=UPI000488C0F0|nr:hypothetical protein [Paraburkholderia ferrariae]